MPSSEAPANVSPADAFEIGYSFAMDLRGQTMEDSRAVGRLLHGYGMEAIADRIDEILRRDGFDSFRDADHGICQAKRIIRIALGADEPPIEPHGGTRI
jgi:hypothetical protein